jgi:hypothetical protein
LLPGLGDAAGCNAQVSLTNPSKQLTGMYLLLRHSAISQATLSSTNQPTTTT